MSAATSIPDKYKNKRFKFPFDNDEVGMVGMVEEHYAGNGRLCIQLIAYGEFPEPFATLTMNLSEDDPGDGCFFVKTYAENAPLMKTLLDSGVFIAVEHPNDTAWRFAP